MDALKQYGWFGLAAVLVAAGFVAPFAGGDVMAWMGALLAGSAGIIQSSPRKGTFATAAVCFGTNAYLMIHKLEGSGNSACNVNEIINCDLVNSSPASEMFGIPITLFGMGFYGGLAIATMFSEKNTPKLHQVNALFAIVALIYSAYLGYQAKLIGAVCVMCISLYIGNALLLWAGIKGIREDGVSLFSDLPSLAQATSALVISGTFALTVLLGSAMLPDTGPKDIRDAVPPVPANADPNSAEFLSQLFNKPRGQITLDGTEPILGDPNAPYLLVEWADYMCPHCARAAVEVRQLVTEFPQIQVRFKTFPLTAQCNPGIEHDGGPERCKAAMTANCAQEQGKFWELQHLLFANQGRFSDDDLAYMAEQVDLDMEKWVACMENKEVVDGIVADARAGMKAGVTGTPAMYLKGTHGSEFVEVIGAGAALRLIDAHANGIDLPEPGPYRGP